MLGACYVSALARLITTAEQDNDPLPADGVVDTIALTDIDAEFTYTASDGPMVSEIAFFHAINTNKNLRLCASVA